MNISFTSRHYELRDSFKSFIEEKIKSLSERYFRKHVEVQVVLTAEKHRYLCELNVRSNGFKELLRRETNDMQQSVQGVLDKFELILRKQHEKRVNRKKLERKQIAMVPVEGQEETSSEDSETEEVPEIVEVEMVLTKPISVFEAAVILKDSDDQFVVFREAKSDKPSVLYRRAGGGFGLIKP